jgi:hypothetical protein
MKLKYSKFGTALLVSLLMLLFGIFLPYQSVIAAPSISVYPKSGAVGTKITVYGTNFLSYAGDALYIFFDNIEVSGNPVFVASNGTFQLIFQVPPFAGPGDTFIEIRGKTGTVLTEVTFNVIAPEVRLNIWGGTVGTTVTAHCKGFFTGKQVTFRYKITSETFLLGTQVTSDTGECSLSFTIPASPDGKHLVIADNTQGNSATAEFDIIPIISIEPPVGAVGDMISVSGMGFVANSEVVVNLHGRTVAYSTTSERGSFNALFIVPVLKAGTYLVETQDISRTRRWGELTLVARIALNKTSGDVSEKITVKGSGFEVGSNITIKYDSEEIGTIKADDTGAFSSSFPVPASSAGSHVITATDGVNIEQDLFTVESEAPPTPQPLTPKQKAVVAIPIVLDWEGIYDPSQPVIYSIQIAHSDDFSRTVLEKTGITMTQYTLNTNETLLPNLRSNYYYWRVRATDGASNIGEWSNPASFHIKPSTVLPAWSKYILILTQMAIVILLIYRLRKAFAGEKKQKPSD